MSKLGFSLESIRLEPTISRVVDEYTESLTFAPDFVRRLKGRHIDGPTKTRLGGWSGSPDGRLKLRPTSDFGECSRLYQQTARWTSLSVDGLRNDAQQRERTGRPFPNRRFRRGLGEWHAPKQGTLCRDINSDLTTSIATNNLLSPLRPRRAFPLSQTRWPKFLCRLPAKQPEELLSCHLL